MRKFNGSSNFGGKSGGRSSSGRSFKKFDRSSRDSSSGSSFGAKKRFGGADSDRGDTGFKLHQATCDKCGKTCDLPFKPTGGKPVYCRSCFRAGNNEPRHDFGTPEGSARNERFESDNVSSATKQDIDAINKKLDKIMKALQINQ